MKLRMLGTLAILLAGAGFSMADPGTFGGLTIFEKWKQRGCATCCEPCEPCCVPTHLIPAPKLFRAEVDYPTHVEGKKLPPIQLLRGVPPNVELIAGRPPEVELVRGLPPQVELVRGIPPQVELFRRQPEAPSEAPSFRIPGVKIFRNETPPCPSYPPPVCTCPCAGTH